MTTLSQLLRCSGNTAHFEERYQLWIHQPYEEESPHQVPLNMLNLIKYADCPVLYHAPDIDPTTHAPVTTIGVAAPFTDYSDQSSFSW